MTIDIPQTSNPLTENKSFWVSDIVITCVVKQVVANMLNYPTWKKFKEFAKNPFSGTLGIDALEFDSQYKPLIKLISDGIVEENEFKNKEYVDQHRPENYRESLTNLADQAYISIGKKFSKIAGELPEEG